MAPPLFRWHPRARVFADGVPLDPQLAPACAQIPATHTAQAMQGLHNALGRVAFCVGDPAAMPHLDRLDPQQFATLTGGTSGPPKIIARSQSSWIASFECNAARFDYTARDSVAILGSLDHSLALYGALEAVHLGLDLHLLDTLTPAARTRALRAHNCTILYATPTQLRLLADAAPLPDLRVILCGGGALDAATRRRIGQLCPNADLRVFYGAAETSFVTMGDADTPEGSVGRAYPQVEIALRARDAAGTGTIWVRSPYVFDRYLHGDSPHTRRDGAWMTVGERGHMDAQGNLFVRGRAGRAFNVADQTVFPEELEAQLAALPDVTEVVILPRPDPLRGNHLIAVMDGADDDALRDRLIAHCKAHALHVPRTVTFLDPFPRLPSGKPDLRRIATLTGATA